MQIGNASSVCNPGDTDPSLNPFIDSRKTWQFLLVVVTSSILNILLIYGIRKTSRTFSKTTTLFFLISLADFANTILPLLERLPGYIGSSSLQDKNLCFFATFVTALRWLIFHLQAILLSFLSSLRFISINRPLVRITTKILVIALLTAFTLSFTLIMILFVMKYLKIHEEILLVILLYDVSMLVMALYITIVNILSYIRLIPRKNGKITSFKLRKSNELQKTNLSSSLKTRETAPELPSPTRPQESTRPTTIGQIDDNTSRSIRAVLNQRKAVITLLILTTLYWICCAPLIVLFNLYSNGSYLKPHRLVVDWALCLYYAYSGINSLVYIWRTRKLRKFFCSIVKNKTCESTIEQARRGVSEM